MADETEVEVKTETQQVWSMDENKFVDVPVAPPVDKKPAEEEEEEEEKEKTDDDHSDEIEKPDPSKEDAKTEDKPKDDDADPKKDDAKKDDDGAQTVDEFIQSTYEKKYGIKTQAELEETIQGGIDAIDEVTKLKEEVATLKLAKPKFENDQEEKAFNFIKKFDVSRQGEGLHTYAKLIGMDIEATDGTLLLEEKFVHEHPEWTREEAQRMFAKDFKKKYSINRDDFESEADYNAELQDMETLKKGEIHRAKQYLKEQQEKYKPTPKEEAKSKVPEIVLKGIETNLPEYTKFIKETNDVTFEKAGAKIVYKLDAAKKAMVDNAMNAWVKNPASYNDKGQLTGVKNPNEMLNKVVGALFLDDLIDVIYDQVKNDVNTKRVEEVAKINPNKRSAPGAGDTGKKDDLYAQAAILIKKRKG